MKTHSIISRYHSIPSIIFSLYHTIILSDPPNSHCLLSYFGPENAPDIPGSRKGCQDHAGVGEAQSTWHVYQSLGDPGLGNQKNV